MANDAKFNFYLNRQGPRGQKGEKGDQGFSPSITVNTNTADEYTLLIQNEYDSFVTDNIRPTYDDRGGTYVRVDRANNVQYFGSADMATTANYGEVKLAQASDLASTVDVGNSNVITVELLKTWFDGQLADNLVTTTNNVTIQGQKIFATPTRFMDTVRIGNRLMVTQDDTGTITFDSSETGTVIGTKLTSTGDANFNQNVAVDGIATIKGGLNVAGNAVISSPQLGNTTISGGLTTEAGISIQGQDIHLQHTNPTMYLKNMNGVNEIEIFSGLFTAGNPSPADNYLHLGHSQLQLNLSGKAIKANGKDVATTDTVESIQSDLNIAKQDIIEAQGDIDNLQMNKQNKLTAGSGITIDADNVISATGGVVDLPIASNTTLGGIKVGENLTISEDGTLSATGGSGTTIDDSTTSSTSTWSSSKINSEVNTVANEVVQVQGNVASLDELTSTMSSTINQKTTLQQGTQFTLNLTGNGTLGGSTPACTGSSYESGHPYYYAFKGATSSTPTQELWGPSGKTKNQYLILDCVTPIALQSFRWTNGSDSERFPTIVFKGSNDNSNYTTLGTYNTQNATDDSVTIENYTPYRYYRFDFPEPANWGKIGFISMSGVNRYNILNIGDGLDVINEQLTCTAADALANKQDKLTAISPVNIATKVLSPTVGWTVSSSSMQSIYKERVVNNGNSLNGDKTTMHLSSDSEYPIKSYVAMPYSVGQVVKYRQNRQRGTETTLVLGDIIDGKIYPILINSAIGDYRPQYTTALFDGTQELTKEVMTNGISYSSADEPGPINQSFINEATFGCLQNTGTKLIWHVFTPRSSNNGDYGNVTYTNFNGYTIDDLVGKIKYAIILTGKTSLAYTPDQFGVYENTLSSYSDISNYQALSPNLFDLSKNEVQTQITTLPATISSLGVVKPDGTTITINDDGTISAIGGSGTTIDDSTTSSTSTWSSSKINSALNEKANLSDLANKVDLDAQNLSAEGKSLISGLAMPSNKYIDLTLGETGSVYTAPANGYFYIKKIAGSDWYYVRMKNTISDIDLFVDAYRTSPLTSVIPAKKGENVYIYYNATGTTEYFRFIYAEGSK